MSRVPPLGLLALLLAASPVGAGDFSGFYAGAHVGTGFEGDRDGRKPGIVPRHERESAPSADLPPSAAGAARTLTRERRPGAAR